MNGSDKGRDTKVAWIVGVGAVHGTGAAVAQRFAKEGFTAVVTGRSPTGWRRSCARSKRPGG